MLPAEIRDALPSDAEAIARLHATSWRDAYRGIMPDAYLDGPLEESLGEHWRVQLGGDGCAGSIVLLALVEGTLTGFVAGRPEPVGCSAALIENLHVHPAHRGRGLGRELLGLAAGRLAAAGCCGISLWVYDDNRAALTFYDQLGADVTETGLEQVGGAVLAHRRLAWPDAAALARLCALGREGASRSTCSRMPQVQD